MDRFSLVVGTQWLMKTAKSYLAREPWSSWSQSSQRAKDVLAKTILFEDTEPTQSSLNQRKNIFG